MSDAPPNRPNGERPEEEQEDRQPPAMVNAPGTTTRRRQVRRLNRTGMIFAAGVIAFAAGGLVYVFTIIEQNGAQKAQRETQEGHTADLADIMKHAPAHGIIGADTGSQATPPPVTQATLGPPLPDEPQPGMSHVEIEGRRQMWTAYYEALQSAQQHRRQATLDALSADTGSASKTETAGSADQVSYRTGPANGAGAMAARSTSAGGQSQNFFDQPGATADNDYLGATVTDPISPYEIKAADIIDARMISGLTSDSHGIVRAMVAQNVYDHATGSNILIPQGSQLVGIYNTSVGYGQKRVEVAWQRVIFPAPCDQSLDLGQMPGADQSGYSGFHDITDNHLAQIWLNALLLSAFAAGAQVSQEGNYSSFGGYNSAQVAAGAMGQQLATLGEEFARRGLDIPPTEKVRNGYPFTVMVTKDIAFTQPWVAGQCGQQEVSVAQR